MLSILLIYKWITRSLSFLFVAYSANKVARSVFTVGRTRTVCSGVCRREQWPPFAPKIERKARNDQITSTYICHDYGHGDRCFVRGRRSRQCRRWLYSKQPYFEHPEPRSNNRRQSGESLGCFVRERESHLDFEPGPGSVHSSLGDG